MTTKITLRTLATLSIATALGGMTGHAHAEQAWARVVSATPSHETTGNTRYNVTYEYGGRTYTTVTDSRPGASIPIEVGGYGVATTSPVAPQPRLVQRPVEQSRPDWNEVTPEQGVVVSGDRGPAPVYYAPPVPVYTQPAPVYYAAPVYAYPQPYIYPPVGISLNLGYSRGWGGGYRGGWHGGHGRWR